MTTDDFFVKMEAFIQECFHEMETWNVQKEDFRLYIPSHVVTMFENHITRLFGAKLEVKQNEQTFFKSFCGVRIIDGYENKIVVSYRDAVLRGHPPRYMLIP